MVSFSLFYQISIDRHSISIKKKKSTQINDNTIFHSNHFQIEFTNQTRPMLLTQVQQAEALLEQRERAGTSFGKPLLSPFVVRVWIRACPLVGYAGMPGGPILRCFLAGIAGSHRIRVQGKSFFKLDKLPLCTITAPWETNLETFSPSPGNAIGIITINYSRGLVKFFIAWLVSYELNFNI